MEKEEDQKIEIKPAATPDHFYVLKCEPSEMTSVESNYGTMCTRTASVERRSMTTTSTPSNVAASSLNVSAVLSTNNLFTVSEPYTISPIMRNSVKRRSSVYNGYPQIVVTTDPQSSKGFVPVNPLADSLGLGTKRPRGRPKKYSPSSGDSTTHSTGPVLGTKRMPGRPKKNPISGPSVTVNNTESDSATDRRHSQRRNLPLSNQDAITRSPQAGSGTKRPRSRPRKLCKTDSFECYSQKTDTGRSSRTGKNVNTQVLPVIGQSSLEAEEKAGNESGQLSTTFRSEIDVTGENDPVADTHVSPGRAKQPASEIEQEQQTNNFLQQDIAVTDKVDNNLIQNTSPPGKLPGDVVPRVAVVPVGNTGRANDGCNLSRKCAGVSTTDNSANSADVEGNSIGPRNFALCEAIKKCEHNGYSQDSVITAEERGDNVPMVSCVSGRHSEQKRIGKVTVVEQPNTQSCGRVTENLVSYFIKHKEEEKGWNQQDVDEDKAFFMSILSSVKQLSPSHRLDFRLDVLNNLKKYCGENSQAT